MKAITILLILLFSNTLWAKAYRFGNLIIAVDEVDGYTVNESCLDKQCMAFKMAKKHSGKLPSPSQQSGGKNPLAVKCKTMMKGKVVIGHDANKAEQSFCFFNDNSYLMLDKI